MNLYTQAYKELRESGVVNTCSHSGLHFEVFTYSEEVFTYIGPLKSPDMPGYDLSSKYNPMFYDWFMERMKAYAVMNGWDDYKTSTICFRGVGKFGHEPRVEEMTFPFPQDKETKE